MKKGQIALYLILSLVLVIAFFTLFFLLSQGKNTEMPLIFDRSSIDNYITLCVKSVSDTAFVKLGKQGGSLHPDDYLTTPFHNIKYDTDLINNTLPNKRQIEKEISTYIEQNINSDCLNNFQAFKDLGWTVELQPAETETAISKDSVSLRLSMPVNIIFEQKKITLDEFAHTKKLRFGHIHDLTNSTISSMIDHQGLIDLTLIKEHDINATIFPYNNKLIISFKDEKSWIDNEPYQFMFAVD